MSTIDDRPRPQGDGEYGCDLCKLWPNTPDHTHVPDSDGYTHTVRDGICEDCG